MRATARDQARQLLSSDWDGIQARYAAFEKASRVDRARVVRDICTMEFDRVESASLRMDKFVHLLDEGKNHELNAVCAAASTHRAEIRHLAFADVTFDMELMAGMMVNHAGGVLENAGVCLDRFGNFPVIPGSALKGIARHYAWEQWSVTRGNHADTSAETRSAAGRLLRVFGFPTGDGSLDLYAQQQELCRFDADGRLVAQAGGIAFLPAFPADGNWELTTDVLTPHGGNDYTNPIPTFFLAVREGCVFRFSLKRLSRAEKQDIETAEEWLRAALGENGAGAKTSAGYGWFGPRSSVDVVDLSLVTPAFMGGASRENAEDTALRIPSLRGMLRWWWRCLYRGALDEGMLKELEGAVWGTTEKASLLRFRILSAKCSRKLFDYKDRFNLQEGFAQTHDIDPRRSGLLYLAYGMDENSGCRYYIEPGATWELETALRGATAECNVLGRNVASDLVREQALLALSLLTQFGGIGSKARHGFGSLSWDGAFDLHDCTERRDAFLRELNLHASTSRTPVPYSMEDAISAVVEIPTGDVWRAIDALGRAVQEFASSFKHNPGKAALGLPRKIHGPMNNPLRHQNPQNHTRPKELLPVLPAARNGRQTRFASPVWYHLVKDEQAGFRVNVTAFPSGMLTADHASRDLLGALVVALSRDCRLSTYPGGQALAARRREPGARRSGHQARAQKGGVKAGDKAEVTVLEGKTKKGGWKVEHAELGEGPVQNSAEVPSDTKPGDTATVLIAVAEKGRAQFKWPKKSRPASA